MSESVLDNRAEGSLSSFDTPGSRGTVLQVSTNDGVGGAARAARRLHDGLNRAGWESWMVAGLERIGGERVTTIVREAQPRLAGIEALAPYVGSRIGETRMRLPGSRGFLETELFERAAVVNLHNLHGGYFDYLALPTWSARKPIVWTLHDMWSFTGHCAYSFECERWETGCRRCPMWRQARALDEIPRTPWDNSRAEWRRKRHAYAQTPITVVAPTHWLAACAERSVLAPDEVHVVPYGLDTEVYAPMDRRHARELVGLAPEVPVVAFGAAMLSQERKGIRHLIEALELVRRDVPGVTFLAMGSTVGMPPELTRGRMVGDLSDERLQRAVYASADVLALPSLADNQPLSMLEAMACGIPVVAFDTGGIPETIEDRATGRLVPAGESGELAQALTAVLSDPDERDRLGEAAREQIMREHRSELQAERYGEIYSEAVSARAAAI